MNCRQACNKTYGLSNSNTILGYDALETIIEHPGCGKNNTAIGICALEHLCNNRNESTAVGAFAFENNNNGENTGVGAYAGAFNKGTDNTAVGNWALRFNECGNGNTAIGFRAMAGTLSDCEPCFFGNGQKNIAVGTNALRGNVNGSENVVMGFNTLLNNTCGNSNVSLGNESGLTNTVENFNTLLGADTDIDCGICYGTAIGAGAIVKKDNSIVLGRHNDYVGIGTSIPRASLHVEGGHVDRVTKTSDAIYEVCNDDYYIIAAGNTSTVTLPNPSSSFAGHVFIVKNLRNNNLPITLDTSLCSGITNGGNIVTSLSVPYGTTYALIHDSVSCTASYQVLYRYP